MNDWTTSWHVTAQNSRDGSTDTRGRRDQRIERIKIIISADNLEVEIIVELKKMVIVARVVRIEIFENLDLVEALIEEILHKSHHARGDNIKPRHSPSKN